MIVEDDPYAQVRFEGEPVPPLRALTDEGIIYLGTLSKVFSPGMRIGWILAPEPVRERLELAKGAADLCSSSFTQLVAAEYLGSAHVEEDLELVRKTYKERRDTMLDGFDAAPSIASRVHASAGRWLVPVGHAARNRSTRRRCSRGRSKPASRTFRVPRSIRRKRDGTARRCA